MNAEPALDTRRTVHYAGRVQGVGFRATAWEIARRYRISGYVENRPDGQVRLVAEGPRAEVEGLLAELRLAMRAYIRGEQVAEGEFRGEFDGFRIRH